MFARCLPPSLARLRASLLVAVLLGLLAGCRTAPTPPPTPQADFGDAPEGDFGMEAGYYLMQGSGFGVYTLAPSGVGAEFETVGRTAPLAPTDTVDGIPGPYTIDVDDFFIGPLFRRPLAGDIPTLEADADRTPDQDTRTNLQPTYPLVPNRADFDRENATHSPGLAGLPSVRTANALVVIYLFAAPPPAIFITAVHTSAGRREGQAWWNVLLDLSQDGQWGNGPNEEWIAQDLPVPLIPGTGRLLISHPFLWGSGGGAGGFGRIHFPVWCRNLVTDEKVRTALNLPINARWDGRGPAGGFAKGEVEDYFIEWRPIGPRYEGAASGGETVEVAREHLVGIAAPPAVAPGAEFRCELSGAKPGKLVVLALADPERGGAALGSVELRPQGSEGGFAGDGFSVQARWESSGSLWIGVEMAPSGAQLVVYGLPADEKLMPGSDAVGIVGGAAIAIE